MVKSVKRRSEKWASSTFVRTYIRKVIHLNSNLGNYYTKLIHRDSYATAAEFNTAIERPQILFGKSDPFLYGIILSDNTGDTFCGGGTSAILGYCNGYDGSGTQILMKFTGIFRWRSVNTPSAWSEWISPLSNADFERYIQANGNATYLVSPNGNYKLGISNSGEVWINNTRIHPA